jgi:4-amino-4-deoxy-L-arabinose transferase
MRNSDLDLVGSGVTFGIVLLVAYILVYIGPLAFRPLYLPDETRYAEIPREMLATGDWIVPRLNGLRYFEKPVLGYWVTALSILSFGENRFAVRLPCALATGLSALLLALLLRRSGHTASALIGAGVFLTSVEVYGLGMFNVLDALFSAFVTASMTCFYLTFRSGHGRAKIVYLCASGVACGLGFLTKGFLAFAIPAVTIVPFLLWQKRWRDLYTLLWVPVLVALAIVLPWAIMIHLREPDYWRYFIFVEHFKRFFSADSSSLHPQPFWIFLPCLIGGAIPWTFVAIPSMRGLHKVGWHDPLARYLLCWLLFPFFLLSASKGKLGSYILPCFAPLSLLLALGLFQSMKELEFRSFRTAARTCSAVIGLVAAVTIILPFLHLASVPVFASDEGWKWAVGGTALVAWSAICFFSARAKNITTSLGLFAVAPVALMLSAHFIVPEKIMKSRAPEAFIERCAKAINREDQIYSTNYLAPAICWVLKRSDIGILQRRGELQYGLNYPDAKHRQIQISELEKQIDDRTRTRGIVVMVTESDFSRYRGYLPKPTRMEEADGFIFLKYRVP